MRKVGLALVAVTAVILTGPAFAGSTCKIIPGFCPTEEPKAHQNSPTSVPEPASMLLLGAGVAAVGAAVARRRKKDN